jgi:hypothetical protein
LKVYKRAFRARAVAAIRQSGMSRQNVRINKVHRADLFHPSERSLRANSELSSMSTRSRHIPKNSEFSKSLKVEWGRDPEDETVITIFAGPVGTSAGSLMRSSRLAGISALRVTVFIILVRLTSDLIKINTRLQQTAESSRQKAELP